MGQVVKLCNNLVYAAQMLATAEATALAVRSGVDMAKLHEVLVHSTGDCVAVRTRLPVAGVVPESPASNGWQPGFMTELMAKDLDLALGYGAGAGVPHRHDGDRPPGAVRRVVAGFAREDFSSVAKIVFSLSGVGRGSSGDLILAADHRARGVVTIERYDEYLAALAAALPHCDGILATTEPLRSLRLVRSDRRGSAHLSLDQPDRSRRVDLRARRPSGGECGRAADEGWTGVKIMTRVAMDDLRGAEAIELLGKVLEESRAAGLEAMVEAVVWRGGRMSKLIADIVLAAVIAHDLGAPLLKVPVPEAPTGDGAGGRNRPGGGERRRTGALPRRAAPTPGERGDRSKRRAT